MAADKKQKPSNSIPIHFADSDETPVLEEDLTPEDLVDVALVEHPVAREQIAEKDRGQGHDGQGARERGRNAFAGRGADHAPSRVHTTKTRIPRRPAAG